MPVGVIKRLACCAHRKNNEVVDLALVFRLHPLVGVEGAARAVAARHYASDLAGQIGNLEGLDLPRAAFAVQDALPGRLDATAERRDHAKARDDNPPHPDHSSPRFAVSGNERQDREATVLPSLSAPRGGVSSSRSFLEI